MNKRVVTTLIAVLVVATPLLAHVSIQPREAKLGATQTYTVSVPSEGGKTTTSVILDIPDGVSVTSVAAPEGATHTEKKVGDRIVSLMWTMEIKAGAKATFEFVAKNPDKGETIAWKVMQHYTDGTMSNWTPATKLLPADGK